MAVAHDFSKMVPGFDFLQGLVKNASSALPNLGQWVAPTLDPDELAKRIEELKTVQFWLEQNARMIATTVQALEVQRMTLSTLKSMNVQVADLAQAFKLKDPVGAASPAASAPPAPAPAPAPAPRPARTTRSASSAASATSSASETSSGPASSGAAAGPAAPAAGVVDPMQWWGALTQQFTQLAAQALKDGSAGAASELAGAMVKTSAEAMGQALQSAGLQPKASASASRQQAARTADASKAQATAGATARRKTARTAAPSAKRRA